MLDGRTGLTSDDRPDRPAAGVVGLEHGPWLGVVGDGAGEPGPHPGAHSSFIVPVPGALGNQSAAASPYSRSSGCDRLDRPPVTHRLDSEASATTGDLQDAPFPDPKASTGTVLAPTNPDLTRSTCRFEDA
jgi:hypothetical protein